MKVKAAVTLGYQQPFSIKDIQVSAPKKDEVMVKIVATGVCHTDAVIRDNAGILPMPAILGHEGAGIVVNVGDAVRGVEIGDHVVLSYAACHHCENCLTNHPSACESFNDLNFGGRLDDGTTPYRLDDQELSVFFGQSSFSQYVVTKATNAIVVDRDVELSLLGPLGCGIQTGSGTVLNRLKPVAGESLVVFGCRAVGLSAIMAAKLTGCSQIIAVDIHANRLELARELGATHVINGKQEDSVAVIRQLTGKGAHYAIETTGVAAIVLQAIHAIKPLGTVAVVGFTGDITFNVQNDLMAEGKSLIGVIEGDAVPQLFIPQLVQFYKQGKFPIDKLIEFYPLEEINQAFADSASGNVIKPVVLM
ncbi:TPA: NAD(P)-dependent alcohol dehydrogenase [Klebsiella aerogenes]|nr:NAD(P)-dependent alcohol dehydrogenase [Klebsiella aerogenes]